MARAAPLSQLVGDVYDPRAMREVIRSMELRIKALERATAHQYTVTNPTTNRTLDVSSATLAETRQVLGTWLQDIKEKEKA